jgi:membrane protease YdiL (CAAX protease family)
MRGWLIVEFCFLFVALPVAFAVMLLSGIRPFMIPTLLIAFVGCLLFLIFDRRFNRRNLWRSRTLPSEAPRIAMFFLAGAVCMAGVVLLLAPERFLSFPRENTRVWAIIMILYPVFSVYPQELVYRTFLFHRYRTLFRSQAALILASAFAFGLMHIVFLHWLSVLMTFAGGLLFAWTYARTRSTLAVTVEHALYGCFVFTVGLGSFFYGGAAFQRANGHRERAAITAPALPAVDASLDPVVLVEGVGPESVEAAPQRSGG